MNDDAEVAFFLDEGVPRSVGRLLDEEGFRVIFFDQAAAKGTPDPVVCDIAMMNDAVLVALDGDMRQIARGAGVSKTRFKKLSLLKLSCLEPKAVQRVKDNLPFLRLQLSLGRQRGDVRRLFVEIGDSWIRINQSSH